MSSMQETGDCYQCEVKLDGGSKWSWAWGIIWGNIWRWLILWINLASSSCLGAAIWGSAVLFFFWKLVVIDARAYYPLSELIYLVFLCVQRCLEGARIVTGLLGTCYHFSAHVTSHWCFCSKDHPFTAPHCAIYIHRQTHLEISEPLNLIPTILSIGLRKTVNQKDLNKEVRKRLLENMMIVLNNCTSLDI